MIGTMEKNDSMVGAKANDAAIGQMPPPDSSIYENGIDLPSYGMSSFVNMGSGEQVKQLLSRLKSGADKVLPPVAVSLPDPNTTASTITQTDRLGPSENQVIYVEGQTLQTQDAEGEIVIQLGADNGERINSGGTRPLTTVDSSQIELDPISYDPDISDSALFGEGVDMNLANIPTLKVSTAGYSRFRYQSERNTANKRPRQYEMDEEKRCLAEIEIKNYTGRAQVAAYCVNREGKLHPYNLFGNDCYNGVFVKKADFSKRHCITKLLKVSVTTPKTKEYNNSIQQQKKYLESLNLITEDEVPLKYTDNGDKQVVYLMVKVVLEDGRGTMLASITKEIRNKKEGNEFRIRTVIPPCVPIHGPCEGNPDKTKVCVIVTEKSAFPKDVCVVLKKKLDNGGEWIRLCKGPQIDVIRKSVVEFVPPPFREPSCTTDVDVELILRDLKTGQETEPATFTYTGTDEYGLINKGKKRKLTESFPQDFAVQETLVKAERNTIRAIRTRTSTATLSDLSDSSPETSLTMAESHPGAPTSGNLSRRMPEQDPMGEREISIEGMRRTRVGSKQQAMPIAVTTAMGTAQIVTSGSYTTQPQYQQLSRPMAGQPAPINVKNELLTPVVSTNSMPVFSTGQQARPAMAQPASQGAADLSAMMPYLEPVRQEIAKKAKIAPEDISWEQVLQVLQKNYEKQVGGTSTAGSSVAAPGPAVQQAPPLQQTPPPAVINPMVSSQFPKLQPNQVLAVIQGQIVIINDDTDDNTAAGNSSIQDIGGQEVHVQKMPVQQPSSEMTVGDSSQANAMAMTTALQYSGMAAQTTQNYTTQQNQPGYGYQQAPAASTLSTIDQSVLSNPALQQAVQTPAQGYNQQYATSGVPWHQYSTNLDDDDIEIDSGAAVETGNEKKAKKQKSDKSGTSDKEIDMADGESDGNFQNLPRIITDVSEESEGEEGRKTDGADTEGKAGEVVVVASSSEDSDDMQS